MEKKSLVCKNNGKNMKEILFQLLKVVWSDKDSDIMC
uniref:Uncharacterized protein n=1 Tax=Rhizophora mucronata TaxID=61149 RepID=A0A2P2QUZ5_RHIMU